MNLSYWETQFISNRVDLIIIGGGITGLSTAYFASQRFPKKSILVIEKLPLSTGASTRNAGFACFGSAGELQSDLDSSEKPNQVYETVKMRWEGLELLKKTLGETTIDYQYSGGIELFDQNQNEEYFSLMDKISLLNSDLKQVIGKDSTYSSCEVPRGTFGFKNAIKNAYEGKLNPGLMMKQWRVLCEKNNVKFLNGIEAKLKSDYSGVYINNYLISSDQIAVCTNGFSSELGLDLKVKPARNLVLLTHPLPKLKLDSTYHHKEGFMYFRMVKDRLLLGGGRHQFLEQEFSSEFKSNPQVKTYLIDYLKQHFLLDERSVAQEWSGIMGVSSDKEVIVKRINKRIVCGVKLGGMGVAIGTLVGKKVSELLNL